MWAELQPDNCHVGGGRSAHKRLGREGRKEGGREERRGGEGRGGEGREGEVRGGEGRGGREGKRGGRI